jgi:hypothetical protein
MIWGIVKMDISGRLKREWEKRLPFLDGDWTHWLIEGDGSLLAVIQGENIVETLNFIEENYERYGSIMAYRAKINEEGDVKHEKKRRHEIANYKKEGELR